MSGMVAYCEVAVDHFLKMWKSLTLKSTYGEPAQSGPQSRFLTEICFGWPAWAGWPAAGWLGLAGLGWLGGCSFLAGWLAGLLACRLGI